MPARFGRRRGLPPDLRSYDSRDPRFSSLNTTIPFCGSMPIPLKMALGS
jgi:hypothetical protein